MCKKILFTALSVLLLSGFAYAETCTLSTSNDTVNFNVGNEAVLLGAGQKATVSCDNYADVELFSVDNGFGDCGVGGSPETLSVSADGAKAVAVPKGGDFDQAFNKAEVQNTGNNATCLVAVLPD